MSVIYVLIPVAIILTCIGIYLFFWAVKTEQFDDLDKEGLSILFDDEQDQSSSEKQSTQTSLSGNKNKERQDISEPKH